MGHELIEPANSSPTVLVSCANVRALETFIADTDSSRTPGFFRLLMFVSSALTHVAQPQEAHCAASARAALQHPQKSAVRICRENLPGESRAARVDFASHGR
jgi:hypothetical protein